jgi:RecJ-like exonuclease
MAIVPINTLKSKFETGDIPTGSDFVDLIDTTSYRADSLGGDGNNSVTINGIESATVFDTIDTSVWRTVKYLIQLSNAASTSYRSTEINLVFDGTNQNITEYGAVKNTNSEVGTISASLNSGTISMTVTPVLSPMTIRYYRTGLKA